MADTSELLRLCDIMEFGASVSRAQEIAVIQYAKSRLQAEAQAPTTAVDALTESESLSMAIARSYRGDRPGLVLELIAIIDRLTSTPTPRTINSATVPCPACGEHVEFKFDAPLNVGAVVGAPAPAPTPTRLKSEYMSEYKNGTEGDTP